MVTYRQNSFYRFQFKQVVLWITLILILKVNRCQGGLCKMLRCFRRHKPYLARAHSILIAKCVGILSKMKHRPILPRNILRSLCQTLLLPHLTYCCIIWSGTSKHLPNELIILQKRKIRHITISHSRDYKNAVFKSMNLLKSTDLFILHVTSFVYRSLTKCFSVRWMCF